MAKSGAREFIQNLTSLGKQGAKPRLNNKITSYFGVIGVREGLMEAKANGGEREIIQKLERLPILMMGRRLCH